MISTDDFKLDPRLHHDCFLLGLLGSSRLLLLNNSLVPWFILVPDTMATEIYELPHPQQLELLEQVNHISKHIKQHFSVDKLNVAAIGNIVSQLHIHIVGRRAGDYCWPGVVWGAAGKQAYQDDAVVAIKSALAKALPDHFIAA